MAPILRIAATAAAALALLTATGAGGATGSGLYGTVRKGPIKPVCEQGVPCDAPAQVTLVFSKTTADGAPLSTQRWRVRSSELGKYRIALEPGYYAVRSSVKIGMTKLPRPHALHVRIGRWDRINLFFDTGIR